jgi:hypothetical protein
MLCVLLNKLARVAKGYLVGLNSLLDILEV